MDGQDRPRWILGIGESHGDATGRVLALAFHFPETRNHVTSVSSDKASTGKWLIGSRVSFVPESSERNRLRTQI